MQIRNFFGISVLILLTGIFSSCHQQDHKRDDAKKTLFREVPSEESGILFANKLRETDSSNAIFYEYYYNGSGLAIGDINQDGLSDIFFGANMSDSRLYLNKGNLSFEDITENGGIKTKGKWVTGVSMVDINGDGWLDIYLCVGGNIHDDYHNLFYINNGSRDHPAFTERAATMGLDDNAYSTQAAFLDYDRDGDLDIYLVTSSMRVPNKNAIRERKNNGSVINTDRLYRNDGFVAGSNLPVFHNVSREAGITWDGFGLGIALCDINRDGWPDIYVTNDYISNDLLYVNQGDGTFKEMIKEYTKHLSYSAMGMDIADFNNDGLVDIFTLDMQPEDYFRKRIMAGNMRNYKRYTQELKAGYSPQYIRNMLQLNNGEIDGQYTFSEIGQLAGVFETDWSWAPLFADFDNDGNKDLFIGNGIPHDLSNMDFSGMWIKKNKENPSIEFSVLYEILMNDLNKKGNVKKPNVIFRNSGSLLFENKTLQWGLDKPIYSTGAAFSDLDNDGDLDLVLNNLYDPASLYENTIIRKDTLNTSHHFLTILLKGDTLNKGGIGAKINLFYKKGQQYYEHFPVRGFQSMVDPLIHFGLGEATRIDSLNITWPDGRQQWLYNLSSDQLILLHHDQSSLITKQESTVNQKTRIFTPASAKTGIDYAHHGSLFVDFEASPLIPHQYSGEGPGIAVADVNEDGLDDFFIGGSAGFPGRLFTQGKKGEFISHPLPGSNIAEDMGVLFFDADADNDQDLYIVSGGTGLPPNSPGYADRLYINKDKGEFVADPKALPDDRMCGSQATAADFDKDGDLDLFVCGRIDYENYPFPPRSYLLRNDSKGSEIRFTDITASACKDLERPGLIAAALWTDFNNDGWTDLILAGEWMPLAFFKNDKGKLLNITSGTGLENYTGWWNSLTAADFDRDGDIDYVAGNLGLNTQYKVSQDQPMQIIAKDFDRNGTLDPVCSYYVQGRSYPIYHRNLLLTQIPSLQNKFKTYEEYAKATMTDIFPESSTKDAYIRDCRFFESAYIENTGNGSFRLHALPMEAQTSPVFGMLANDFNADGNTDLLLAGNSYSSNVYDGQYDAFIGLFLAGNGKGGFLPVLGRESGFFVDGDAKGMAELVMNNGSSLILAARNSGNMRAFKTGNSPSRTIRLGNDEVWADLTYKTGEKEHREFYYGHGYLSGSSRVIRVTKEVVSISITSYNGKTRRIINE